MTGRRGFVVCAMLACLLAATSGCMTRKGFLIDCGFKFEFNRVPWRCGLDCQYEVDGPDSLTCNSHGGRQGCGGGAPSCVAAPRCAGEGCPPAPLPGDCGLPPEQPHPHSRFNPLPMYDVLHGAAPMPPYVPGQGEIIREEELPEAVPPPAKAPQASPQLPPKDSGEKSTRANKGFQLEEDEDEGVPTPARGVTRADADAAPHAASGAEQAPAEGRSAARSPTTSWMFVQPTGNRRAN